MWLFTRHGFYSVTRSINEPDKLQIRARAKGDLERLAGFMVTRDQPVAQGTAKDLQKIIETPDADYRWRVIVTPDTWQIIAVELMADIVYHNFKNEIRDNQRHNDYTRVWGIMNSVQARESYRLDQYSYFEDDYPGDESFFDDITDYGDPQDDWQPPAASFFWDN